MRKLLRYTAALVLALFCLCPQAVFAASIERITNEGSLDSQALTAPRPGQTAPVERESSLNRADPAYIQWLEKHSMLGSAEELARIVSGSQLLWRSPSLPPESRALAANAGVWLAVHPNTLPLEGSATAFTYLSGQDTTRLLTYLRIKGMFLAPATASGAVWAYSRTASMHGMDAIQHDFSEAAGTPEEYALFRRAMATARIAIGTDILPAATGLGPDFFLAARAVRMYPGAYCLIEIPRELWSALPPATSEWRGVPLSAEQSQNLAEAGFLPFDFARVASPWTTRTGVAATGEIRGVDGFTRRWVYLYSKSPDRPILNWDDPSAAGRRILSSSVIQQVGMNGFALVGLHIEPMIGLDAQPSQARNTRPIPMSGEPGITAACSLAREIRRYGGRSMLREEFPIPVLQLLLDEATDFALDSVTSPAAEHALLTGEVRLLRAMLDEALTAGVDFSRLVHAMPDESGINYTLPHLAFLGSQPFPDPSGAPAQTQRLAIQQAAFDKAAAWNSVFPKPLRDSLPLSGAALAALAAGIPPENVRRPESQPAIVSGHAALIFFKAMLPGVLQLSAQDLAGTMPLPWRLISDNHTTWEQEQSNRGAFSFTRQTRATGISRFSVPFAPLAYDTPLVAAGQSESLVNKMRAILVAREVSRIGEGRLAGRLLTRGAGCIAPFTRLEDGGFVLALTNFNARESQENLNVGLVPGFESARGQAVVTDIFTGEQLRLDGSRLPVTVPGRGYRALHLALNGEAPINVSAQIKPAQQ